MSEPRKSSEAIRRPSQALEGRPGWPSRVGGHHLPARPTLASRPGAPRGEKWPSGGRGALSRFSPRRAGGLSPLPPASSWNGRSAQRAVVRRRLRERVMSDGCRPSRIGDVAKGKRAFPRTICLVRACYSPFVCGRYYYPGLEVVAHKDSLDGRAVSSVSFAIRVFLLDKERQTGAVLC
jgi:hypothetical protein